jgi:hypothetical protein
MSRKRDDAAVGGIKGFFQNAYNSIEKLSTSGGSVLYTYSVWLAKTAGTWGFYFATTSMVVFMPLIFEIARERQVSFWFLFGVTTNYSLE